MSARKGCACPGCPGSRPARPKRVKPKKETAEYISDFLIPSVRRAGERVAEDGHEGGLEDLLRLRAAVDKAIESAVVGLRTPPAPVAPLPWDLIGRGLGVTKSAAINRFKPLVEALAGPSPSSSVRLAG